MVEVALIPPYAFIDDMRERNLQMLLPSCLVSHYRLSYQQLLDGARYYRILDNGMFEEGVPFDNLSLLDIAAEFQVDEVVMPDTPSSSAETIEAVAQFLKDLDRYKENFPDGLKPNMKLMAVVQGANTRERTETVKALGDMIPQGSTFGFPRRLTRGNLSNRINTMEIVAGAYGKRFPLHMLGMSREWPGEFLRAVKTFGPYLRGLDTCAPYAWAFNNGQLQALWSANCERPNNYFLQTADKFPRDLVDYNIYVLTNWRSGVTPSSFNAWKDETHNDL